MWTNSDSLLLEYSLLVILSTSLILPTLVRVLTAVGKMAPTGFLKLREKRRLEIFLISICSNPMAPTGFEPATPGFLRS